MSGAFSVINSASQLESLASMQAALCYAFSPRASWPGREISISFWARPQNNGLTNSSNQVEGRGEV